MTEKNIFAYKHFLSLSISDFRLKIGPPPFPSNLPLKVEVLSNPPFFENLGGGSTPTQQMLPYVTLPIEFN